MEKSIPLNCFYTGYILKYPLSLLLLILPKTCSYCFVS